MKNLDLEHGFWQRFAMVVPYARMPTENRSLLSASLCDGIAVGVRLGPPILAFSVEKNFPESRPEDKQPLARREIRI